MFSAQKNLNMKKYIIPGLALLGLWACNVQNNPEESDHIVVNGNMITVKEDSPILKKLECQKVEIKPFTYHIDIPGAVKAIPNQFAMVAAPFSGRITKSFAQLGQQVKEGTPLFEMISSDYLEATKEYLQSRDEMLLAEKNYLRQKDLLEKGVGAQKELEEAELEYNHHKKDFEHALAALSVFRVDTSNLKVGSPLVVRSPIAGTVVENSIVIGQYLHEDSEPVATVARLDRVWVSAQVREKHMQMVEGNSQVNITLMAYPDKKISGKVVHVSPLVDEETRSVEVLVECDNSHGFMNPGMYAAARFMQTIPNSVVIPVKAVLQKDNQSFVFVCTGENQFTSRVISIITEDKQSVVIKGGIEEGEQIVVNGSFYLLN